MKTQNQTLYALITARVLSMKTQSAPDTQKASWHISCFIHTSDIAIWVLENYLRHVLNGMLQFI